MYIQQIVFKTLIALIILFAINQPVQAQQDTPPPKDAHYWISKGDLCAVYGKDNAA